MYVSKVFCSMLVSLLHMAAKKPTEPANITQCQSDFFPWRGLIQSSIVLQGLIAPFPDAIPFKQLYYPFCLCLLFLFVVVVVV